VQELGSVLGPVLGAVILARAGWRAIFWANVVAGLLLYAVIHLLGSRALGTGAGGIPKGDGVRSRSARGGGRSVTALAWVLAVLALGIGWLALAAPERLVTDVTLGAPFVPFAGNSRVLTPIGLVALALLVLLAVLTAPRWWAVLRQSDLFGALLVAVALGSLVLTFASSDPEREVVGPLGYSLLPIGALALLVLWWWHRRATAPLIPRGVLHARGIRSLVVSLLVGAALVAVVVDVPLLARLTDDYDATGAALVLVRFLVAVPVGAFAGGWALRRLGDGAVAGTGLALAAAGLLVMSGWTLDSLGELVSTTVALVVVGLGVGLALAPVNNAVLADSPPDAHGVASSLVVVARMVGMVVGLALLTTVGLSRYYDAVRVLPDPLDTAALIGAAVVQVQTVFLGGALAALAGSAVALTLGLRRPASAASRGDDQLAAVR